MLWNIAVNAIYGNDESGDNNNNALQKKHSNSDDTTIKGLFYIIENQKKTIENQSITIRNQRSETQSKNTYLKDTISELNLMKTERNNLKQQIKSLHIQMKELQNNLAVGVDNDNQHNFIQDTKGANINCDLRTENNRLKEYICRLEEGHSENPELQNRNKQLMNTQVQLLAQSEKLQIELDNVQKENIVLHHYLKVCRGSVSELRQNLTIMRREATTQSIKHAKETDTIIKLLNTTEDNKHKMQIECDSIIEQLKCSELRNVQLTHQLKTTQTTSQKNNKKNEMTLAQLKEMEFKLKITQYDKDKVKIERNTLKKECNELKSKLKLVQDAKHKAEAKVSKLANTIKKRLPNTKSKYSWYRVKKDKFVEVDEMLAQRLDLLKVGQSTSKSKFSKSLTDLVREKCNFGSDSCIVRRRTVIVSQWEWKDDDATFKPYPHKTCKQITYTRNGSIFHFKTNKFKYEIKKISNCKAEQRNIGTNKIREVRSNINQLDSDCIDIYSSSQYYSQCISLTPAFVNSLFYETLDGLECKIDSIEDVMDKSKNFHYELLLKNKCDKYMQSREQIEQILWHGSSFDGLTCIIKSGFDRSYNVRRVFGKGSYFTNRCNYSIEKGYCKKHNGYNYILLCKVICGKYVRGNSKMDKIPKQSDGEEYDSLVDKIDNPSIFVSWRDYMSVPLYLIKFTFKDQY